MNNISDSKKISDENNGAIVGKKILYGILGGTGQTVATILVAFVQIRLILFFLSQEVAGIWFLFLSIGVYIAFFDLGISPTISREISFITGSSQTSEAEKNRKIADLIATCQRIFQAIAIVVFSLGFSLGGLILLKVSSSVDAKEIGTAWLIFALGASLNLLGGTAFAALYGLGNVATERLIRAATQLIGLVFTVILLYLGMGIIGLSIAWIAQNLIARIWGWKMLYRNHPELIAMRGKASLPTAKKITGPSLKWAAMGFGSILILYTDNPIIAATLGPSYIPPYEAVTKIITTLMTLSLLIATSSTPFLSKAYAAGDMATFKALLSRNVRFGMALMITMASIIAVFGDMVIALWLGPGNFVGFPVLWTLLIMLTLEVHHVVHAVSIMSAGHLVFLRAALISGLLKIVLSWMLSSYLGLWGVALGTLIAQLLTNNWYAPYVSFKLFPITVKEYLRGICLPLFFLLVILLLANIGMRRLLGQQYPDLAALLAAAGITTMISAVIAYFLIFSVSERDKIVKNIAVWRIPR